MALARGEVGPQPHAASLCELGTPDLPEVKHGASVPGRRGQRRDAGAGHGLPRRAHHPRHARRAGRLQAAQRPSPPFPPVGRRPAQGGTGPALAAGAPARTSTCASSRATSPTRPSRERCTRSSRRPTSASAPPTTRRPSITSTRLMRQHARPWTLGEVLSGGIGGFVHCFVPSGPCYGCVASFLQRSVKVDDSPPPDYSAPGGPVVGNHHPRQQGADPAIASLHALVTLELLDDPAGYTPPATTIAVDAADACRASSRRRFGRIAFASPARRDCLICQARPTPSTLEELDVALDQAPGATGRCVNSGRSPVPVPSRRRCTTATSGPG